MKTVKYFSATVVAVLITCLLACSNSGVSINPLQQKAVIDSIVQAQSLTLKDSIEQVCTERLQTLAKTKADSIIQANAAK